MSINPKADIVFKSERPADKCCIRWRIRNFSVYLSKYLTSSTRSLSESKTKLETIESRIANSGHKLKLECHKLQNSRDNGHEIVFCMRITSTHETMVNINTKCSLVTNGQTHATKSSQFCNVETPTSKILLKTREDGLIKLLNEPGSENISVFNFDIEVWSDKMITVVWSDNMITVPDAVRVPKNITNFLTNQTLTDVTLCQGKEFKAHKLILAAASPVFKAMFKEGTKEHQENYVNIQDIDSAIFEVFLRYLYTGQVDKLDGMCLDLFAPADKYDVQPLREICIRHMATNISVDNAVNVLILAERHCMDSTKSSALLFISKHVCDVMTKDAWIPFIENYPHLVTELILALANK